MKLAVMALGGASVCGVLAAECGAGGCSDVEDSALLQTVRRSAAMKEASKCSLGLDFSDSDGKPPTGSGLGAECAPNTCCSLFNYTKAFPCPGSDFDWLETNPCLWTGPPSRLSGGYLSTPKHPPAAYDPKAKETPYGEVKFGPLQCLKTHLERQPGISYAEVLHDRDTGYYQGLYPRALTKGGTEKGYSKTKETYSYLWGDLGPEVSPGFGGLKDYDVVKIKAGWKPLQLFHLGHWHDDDVDETGKINPARMCDVWWGLESSYSQNLVKASKAVQTCSAYDALLRCEFSENTEITALVGRGWHRDANGFKTMGCADAEGTTNNWVADELKKQNYPDAKNDQFQFILPTCRIAAELAQTCSVCKLPSDQAGLSAISDLASQFDKPDAGVTCYPLPLDSFLKAEGEFESPENPKTLSDRHR